MPNDDELKKSDPSSEDGESSSHEDLDAGLDGDGDSGTSHGKKSAEARIDELVGKLKSAEEERIQFKKEIDELKTKVLTPAPSTSGDKKQTPEVQKFVQDMKELGFVQETDVKSQVKTIEDRIALNLEHARLETDLDGSDGRPKYERQKVEDYMRDNFVYQPELAYKAMHEAEILDWHMKKSGGKQRPYIEKPGSGSSSAADDNSITREKIAEWTKEPGMPKYHQNRDKILQLMKEGKLV